MARCSRYWKVIGPLPVLNAASDRHPPLLGWLIRHTRPPPPARLRRAASLLTDFLAPPRPLTDLITHPLFSPSFHTRTSPVQSWSVVSRKSPFTFVTSIWQHLLNLYENKNGQLSTHDQRHLVNNYKIKRMYHCWWLVAVNRAVLSGY